MTPVRPPIEPGISDDVFGYLCVDRFLSDAVAVRFLQSAVELGLIERLADSGPAEADSLARALGLDSAGFGFLTARLEALGILSRRDGVLSLTRGFADAWRFRDLIETKIEFASLLAPDFFDAFTNLLRDPRRFHEESYLFSLFNYERCLNRDPESRREARRWMRYTTVLTRYEAPVCLALHDVGRHRRMLDVGGNSGEFALHACRRNPALEATVADLPAVCDVGREHVAPHPESARIKFLAGDWSTGAPPGRYDLVCFKSMLHDWPEAETERFLRAAHDALEPGGTLLIFERTIPTRMVAPGYGSLPILLFFRSFRATDDYLRLLDRVGFVAANHLRVELDSTFMLVAARKEA